MYQKIEILDDKFLLVYWERWYDSMCICYTALTTEARLATRLLFEAPKF